MKLLQRLLRSTLGRKYIMAVTGLVLVGFVVGHMLGNLQVFLGPEAINRYAHFLQGVPELLWGVRLGLVGVVALHLWAAVVLTLENRRARPVGYDQARVVGASYASRTMIWSGLIVAFFVVYHLLHYTARVPAVNLTGEDFGAYRTVLADGTACADVFRMVVTGFSQPWVAGFYLVAVGLLCWHLSHGVAALLQSLGLTSRTGTRAADRLAQVVAWGLFLGYAAIPVAVQLGFGRGH